MPRQTVVLQVFVASPSDVAEERRILDTVIAQSNQVWSSNLGITYELIKWETNVHPTFSSDPQQAINKQVGSDYDVFIGIFWGRVGTPTPRAESGTIEEFDRALERFRTTNTLPKIMLYFKDAPIAPSKINTLQLQQVQEFKNDVAAKGGLFSVFEDAVGFESSVRAHLSAIAQEFAAGIRENDFKTVTFAEPVVTSALPTSDDYDDYGYIDYMEMYEARIAEMTAAMNLIGDATIRIGEQISTRNEELKMAVMAGPGIAKRHIKRTADDMSSYAETLSAQVRLMSVSREAGFSALANALAIHGEFKNQKEELRALRENLVSFVENSITARRSMNGMRESTHGLPRISIDLNKSKRLVVSQLDLLLAEMDSASSTVNNIIRAIDRMLGD
jgi:hypothetical protein